MKKTLLSFGGLLLAAALLIVGCKKDEDVDATIAKYFSVENATLVKQNLPEPTSNEEIVVEMNNSVIPGGSSYVTLQSEKAAKKVFVGMKGQSGYYEFVPARGECAFLVLVNQDIDLGEDATSFTIQVAIEDENGAISKIWESAVNLIVVGTGSLQVSLSFDNAKDVDLHLIEPEYLNPDGDPVQFYERHIYFGNEISYYSGGELDLDSNPSCSIDNVNNENITYSDTTGFVPAGTYKVYVDLYENCDPSIPTNYVVTVFYGGARIASKAGVFEVDAPSTYNPIDPEYVDENEPFLTFTINGQQKSPKTFGRKPLSETAKEKEANSVHK